MAAYLDYVYENDAGTKSYSIKLESGNEAVNGGVVGATTEPFTVDSYINKKRNGVHVRRLRLKREEGAAQDGSGKLHYRNLPICTKGKLDTYSKGDGVQVNAIAWKVARIYEEFYV